jgi:hypothetical protein
MQSQVVFETFLLAYINSGRGFHCDIIIDVYFEQVYTLYYIPLTPFSPFLLFQTVFGGIHYYYIHIEASSSAPLPTSLLPSSILLIIPFLRPSHLPYLKNQKKP